MRLGEVVMTETFSTSCLSLKMRRGQVLPLVLPLLGPMRRPSTEPLGEDRTGTFMGATATEEQERPETLTQHNHRRQGKGGHKAH